MAVSLPRIVWERLGLIQVGGGRGLWAFVELDTLAFDVVLLFALAYCGGWLARRRWRPTPMFVLLGIVFVATAVPMTYTVNNFGTLFRLRQMLYVLAALIPVTLIDRTSAPQPRP